MHPTIFLLPNFWNKGNILLARENNTSLITNLKVPSNKSLFGFYWVWGWSFAHHRKSIISDIKKLVMTSQSSLEFFVTIPSIFQIPALSMSSWYICKTIEWFSQLLSIVDLIFVSHLLNGEKLRSGPEMRFAVAATKINFNNVKT